jgi:hypothetical protein
MGQRVCGPACAGRLVKADKKREAEEFKRRKEKAKPRQEKLAKCQAIVNEIARIRDRADGCISCDKPPTWGGQWHGSHLRSVGAASAVRFNLWNIHKACSQCNHMKGGNLLEYRPRLVAKIGADKVDWLFTQNQIARYDEDYLKRFRAVMGKKLRRMKRRIA